MIVIGIVIIIVFVVNIVKLFVYLLLIKLNNLIVNVNFLGFFNSILGNIKFINGFIKLNKVIIVKIGLVNGSIICKKICICFVLLILVDLLSFFGIVLK